MLQEFFLSDLDVYFLAVYRRRSNSPVQVKNFGSFLSDLCLGKR